MLTQKEIECKKHLCLALDEMKSLEELRERVRELKDYIGLFKVGLGSFTMWGPRAVEIIHEEGGQVFLDLKFNDIPATVEEACRRAASLGVFMCNVHASAGLEAMKAARKGAGTQCKVIAVTVLTAIDESALQHDLNVSCSLNDQVLHLAKLTKEAGLDGIVCSAQDLSWIKNKLPEDFIFLTPGISGSSGKAGSDQKRVMSASEALKSGSTFLVVGRAINSKANTLERQEEARKILKEMAQIAS